MLTHHNIVSNVLACHAMLKKGPQDVAFSFLPLSHAFERTVSYCYLDDGVVVTFAESMDTVSRDLPRVQPTLMTGVPRVFEKLHARIMEAASTSPGAAPLDLHVGARRRPAPRAARAEQRRTRGRHELAGSPRRQTRLLQDPRARRRPPPRDRLGQRAAAGDGRRVLQRGRPADHGRLRPDRNVSRAHAPIRATPSASAPSASRCPASSCASRTTAKSSRAGRT